MDIPAPEVISINMLVFCMLYRNKLRGQFDIQRLATAAEAIRHRPYFRYTCGVLLFVVIAYIAASAAQFPLSIVALAGAALLLVGALCWKQSTVREVGTHISWSIFGFIAGMFILVRAVENTHLTALFGQLLLSLSGGHSFGAVMIGTNLIS